MADVSLMVIPETMTGAILFSEGKADEVLAQIKAQARAEAAKLDISTKENRDALASLAYKVGRTKTATDKMRLDLVAGEKKRLKAIDAEGSRIWDELDALQKEVRKPLTDWENLDKERIKKHEDAIVELDGAGTQTSQEWQTLPVDAMKDRLKEISEEYPSTHDWEEFGSRGALAVKTAISKIADAITKRETYDAEQIELAKLRSEAAGRAQKEREYAAASKAKEEAEAKSKRDAEAAAQKAEEEKQAAVRAEQERAERERKAEKEAERKRAANRAHSAKINGEAKACLLNHTNLTAENAEEVIKAIVKGLVSHVSIQY